MNKYIKYMHTFRKYYYLLTILVKTEIKKKYKGSFLGILWSLINPLLNMIILSIVFSTLFKNSIENFPVYLLSGVLLFSFFTTTTTSSMKSIISSAHLIKKVYIPKYILTLSNIISNFIFFLISLIVLIVLIIVTKANISLNILYAPIYLILLFFFSTGVSLILATITVFFRDVEHLYGVFVSALSYASALFYPVDIIPEKFRIIISLNPIFYYIKGFRDSIYFGVPMDLNNLLISLVIAVLSVIIGVLCFEKNQDKFILYL